MDRVLKCKQCGSESIRVDVGKSARFYIEDGTGYRRAEEDNMEFDIVGEPFCGDCGEEFNTEEV